MTINFANLQSQINPKTKPMPKMNISRQADKVMPFEWLDLYISLSKGRDTHSDSQLAIFIAIFCVWYTGFYTTFPSNPATGGLADTLQSHWQLEKQWLHPDYDI